MLWRYSNIYSLPFLWFNQTWLESITKTAPSGFRKYDGVLLISQTRRNCQGLWLHCHQVKWQSKTEVAQKDWDKQGQKGHWNQNHSIIFIQFILSYRTQEGGPTGKVQPSLPLKRAFKNNTIRPPLAMLSVPIITSREENLQKCNCMLPTCCNRRDTVAHWLRR